MMIPPLPPRDDRPDGEKGFVSMRDHFAMAALTGLLSNVQRYQNEPLTKQAFEIADFMLRERDKHSVGVAGMDPATDRKLAATPTACAGRCSQTFDSSPTTGLTDDEIAAIKHALVWMPPAYNPQHVTLRRLLERAS